MAKPPNAPPSDSVAHAAIRKAYEAGRIVFFTDPHVLNRPDTPVYSAIDVFVPTLVLMASSLTLLFAFGMLEWIVALVLVLLYQVYGAKHVVWRRLHKRTVEAIVKNAHNLELLWKLGGIAIALKDWPERNCIAPDGDWRIFARDYLMDLSSDDTSESSGA